MPKAIINFKGKKYRATLINLGCAYCDMYHRTEECYYTKKGLACFDTYKKVFELKKVLSKL